VRLLRRERRIPRHERAERHGADADAAAAEEMTTSLVKQWIHEMDNEVRDEFLKLKVQG
jgi:hypothetical protein